MPDEITSINVGAPLAWLLKPPHSHQQQLTAQNLLWSNIRPETIISSLEDQQFDIPVREHIKGEGHGEQDVVELTLEQIFAHHDLEASSNTLVSSMDTCTLDDSSDLSGVFDDCDQSCSDTVCTDLFSPERPTIHHLSIGPSAYVADQRFKPFHEEKWKCRLKELIHYKTRNGDCLVPHTYAPNPQLARWVKRQRRQYKLMQEGRQSTMTLERARILKELGFVWDSHDAAWSDKLKDLIEYRKQHGNCQVPSSYRKNPQLATWIKCQRRQYKLYWEGRQSAITPDRITALEQVGLKWEVRASNSLLKNTNAAPPNDYLATMSNDVTTL
eukprot:CAMPEP_0202476004 /NCGR_PEP_ID=MMETSP1360-20130828/93195_1 /ASSEMBLY_ACC=CAM_ASM_000848 /TAXON_ID=515479 /ORGANISM="Licmophora paradoxa, Strain CCMP2313" /LENGTH=327 /DNA_ID=CAMNT_0049103187 /DNA_START=63 /DNA_END=1046 /DNA_ORIENTATION=-